MELLRSGAARLGYQLSPEQLRLFQTYYEVLTYWSGKLNLTAITDFEDVQVKHFLDSLTVATVFNGVRRDARLLDVGTGAGLPGIPLKILFPELRLTLLESVAKKTHFLDHLALHLGLKGVEIVTGRAEDLAHDPEYREQFHVAVSRAVAALPTLLELTLPFCRTGGLLVALKSGDLAEEIELSSRALELLGGQVTEMRQVDFPGLEGHILIVVSKVAPTPLAYPRRPGLPYKRPIIRRTPKGRLNA